MQFTKAFAVMFSLALGGMVLAPGAWATPPSKGLGKAQVSGTASAELVTPEQLVTALRSKKPPIPIHVGFEFLYKQGHLPGSIFVGEGRSPEGRSKILAQIQALPNDRTIVLYCGCCPWEDCPNVQPVYEVAKSLKHKTIQLLQIPKNLEADWIKKGYPTTTSP